MLDMADPSHYCVHEKGMTRLQLVRKYQMAQGQGQWQAKVVNKN